MSHKKLVVYETKENKVVGLCSTYSEATNLINDYIERYGKAGFKIEVLED